MTNSTDRVEIITSVQRRRRWTAPGKRRDLRAGYDGKPGGSSAWRCPKPVVHLAAAGGARQPDRGRQRGKRSCRLLIIGLCRTKFANFIGSWARRRWKRRFSKRPSNTPRGQKTTAAAAVAAEGRFPMKTAAEVIGVSRSILRTVYRYGARSGSVGPRYRTTNWCPRSRRSSPSYRPTAIGGSTPFSSGSRWPAGLKPLNHKRVYRVMKVHGLLLDRHVGGDERRHDGRIAVDERNRR